VVAAPWVGVDASLKLDLAKAKATATATANAKASAKTKANAGVLRYAQNDNNCFWVRFLGQVFLGQVGEC
jgi:hypothetical protein